MLVESSRALLHRRTAVPRRLHQHNWMHGLPFKMRFRRSKLLYQRAVAAGAGLRGRRDLGGDGGGGGFVMVPAMIYILGMPTSMVPGTSLFQIIFVAAAVTVLQPMRTTPSIWCWR